MQHININKVHHFVCGASGADNNRYYPKMDKSRYMDWYQEDMAIFGFVVVSISCHKMQVQFVSNMLQIMHTIEITK